MDGMMEVNGLRYQADNVVGNCWLVKRFKPGAEGENSADFDEAEIWLDTLDPAAVINVAIDRNSWA